MYRPQMPIVKIAENEVVVTFEDDDKFTVRSPDRGLGEVVFDCLQRGLKGMDGRLVILLGNR